MKLTPKQAEAIREACENLDFTVYEQYSGRYMYGKNCFGFYTNAPAAELKLAVELLQNVNSEEEKDEVMELLENMSNCAAQDNLGMDTIYYYKRYEWNDEVSQDCGVCGCPKEDCECEADDGK